MYNLPYLESIIIGDNTLRGRYYDHYNNGIVIGYCPNLKLLDIGHNSCEYFYRFELYGTDSLQSIRFGERSFMSVQEFSLKSK